MTEPKLRPVSHALLVRYYERARKVRATILCPDRAEKFDVSFMMPETEGSMPFVSCSRCGEEHQPVFAAETEKAIINRRRLSRALLNSYRPFAEWESLAGRLGAKCFRGPNGEEIREFPPRRQVELTA